MNFLNSPELQELRKAWQQAETQQNAEDDAWWDSLTADQRAQSFRQITKLLHKADVEDQGSYRHAMYGVFNLDYGDGLTYYMRLHNLIAMGVAAEQELRKKKNEDTDDTLALS